MCCGFDRIGDDWQRSGACTDFFPLIIQQSPSPESVPGCAVAELPAMKGDSLALEQLQLAGGRGGKQGRATTTEGDKEEGREVRDVPSTSEVKVNKQVPQSNPTGSLTYRNGPWG